MLARYKAWANRLLYAMLNEMPRAEVLKQRQTRFVHRVNQREM